MTQYVWGDLREQAIAAFHSQPNAETEQTILDAFAIAPAALNAALNETIDGVKAGTFRSGWGMLKSKAVRITNGQQITATDEPDRARRVANAEAAIERAGMYLPTEHELLDEFFGPRGQLAPWAEDELLRRRIIDKWQAQQHTAARMDATADERAREWTTWKKAQKRKRTLAESLPEKEPA